MPVQPYVDRTFRIGDRHNTLQAEMTAPNADHFSYIVPVHGRVQHFGKVTSDRHGATAHVDVFIQLRHPEPFVGEIVGRPHRLDRELKHSTEGKLEGNGKSGAQARSRFPPVMLSTVNIITLTPASLARCIMAWLSARSLWK